MPLPQPIANKDTVKSIQMEDAQSNAVENLTLDMFKLLGPLRDLHDSDDDEVDETVQIAQHRESGNMYKFKIYPKMELLSFRRCEWARVRERDGETWVREIDIHSRLRHPGIVGFHGWFEDEKNAYLVLEHAPRGNLYSKLRKEGRFPEPQAAKYIAQVIETLQYVHSMDVMVRDLKPEHLMLDANENVKLFGFMKSAHAQEGRRKSLAGTLDYLPPEMFATGGKESWYSNAVDLWTLGVLTYELLTGGAPFEDSALATQKRIRKCDMTPIPDYVTAEARDFILGLLKLNPEERTSLENAISHPWITKHYNRGADEQYWLRQRSGPESDTIVSYPSGQTQGVKRGYPEQDGESFADASEKKR